MLPTIQSGIAAVIGTSSIGATNSPPLSSKIGTIDIIKTTAFAEMYFPSVDANHIAI